MPYLVWGQQHLQSEEEREATPILRYDRMAPHLLVDNNSIISNNNILITMEPAAQPSQVIPIPLTMVA